MRGCYQECLGCQAKTEYRVFPGHIEQGQARAENIPQIAHLLEDSPCVLRCCCGVMRPFEMPLTEGEPKGDQYGRTIVTYRKPWSFPICCVINTPYGNFVFPCCCYLPKVTTTGADGRDIGHSQYMCDPSNGNCCCCVPMYHVHDRDGTLKYIGVHDTAHAHARSMAAVLSA